MAVTDLSCQEYIILRLVMIYFMLLMEKTLDMNEGGKVYVALKSLK